MKRLEGYRTQVTSMSVEPEEIGLYFMEPGEVLYYPGHKSSPLSGQGDISKRRLIVADRVRRARSGALLSTGVRRVLEYEEGEEVMFAIMGDSPIVPMWDDSTLGWIKYWCRSHGTMQELETVPGEIYFPVDPRKEVLIPNYNMSGTSFWRMTPELYKRLVREWYLETKPDTISFDEWWSQEDLYWKEAPCTRLYGDYLEDL